jgi:hypothetical protein
LNIESSDFYFASRLPVLFPTVLPEFAVDTYLLSLYQVLIDCFALFAKKYNVKEMSFVFPLFSGALSSIDCYGKLADSHTASGITKLSVPGEPAYKNYSVDVCHVSFTTFLQRDA